jgi:hypothetical protein
VRAQPNLRTSASRPGDDVRSVSLHFADSDFEKPFRVYSNYLQDLAGTIGGHHGFEESLVDGVHTSVVQLEPWQKINRRRPNPRTAAELQSCLRKSWGALRRTLHEVEDPTTYDEEANAWLPAQAYYAVFHGILSLAVASGQSVPRTHAAALSLVADAVVRGKLPYPWSAWCAGCPQTGNVSFGGLRPPERVHPLSRPTPDTASDRLALFLRTTRTKELERLYAIERTKGVPRRASRRNLNRAKKESMAARQRATTVFDLFWRLRMKANYDDADVFVLGAATESDARQLAESLVLVTDATLAALEALIAAYVGPNALARTAELYARKSRCPNIAHRAESWVNRADASSRFTLT